MRRLKSAGIMPDNTGRYSALVGRRQPVMILRVSFIAVSALLEGRLLHHTGAAYSAVLKTRARALVLSVMVPAPQLQPAGSCMRAEILALSAVKCCLKVSCLPSFTPR